MRPFVALILAAVAAGSATAQAPFTLGNLVIYRVGDGAAGLANTGAKIFLDEYTPTGTLVQSVNVTDQFGTGDFIASGVATSEGFLTRSEDRSHVTLTGYKRAMGGIGSVAGTTGATVNRTIVNVNGAGLVANRTDLADYAGGTNPRTAVAFAGGTAGDDLWIAGGAGGVRYTTIGATTSTQISDPAALVNFRQVNIFGGQLYGSTSSTAGGNTIPLGKVGVGTPTAGPATFTALPGLPVVTGTSIYSYTIHDLNGEAPGTNVVLYMADDGANALKKYSLVDGAWVLNGTIGVDADDYRGLTGVQTDSDTVKLYATRKGGSTAGGGGELVEIVDDSWWNGALTATPTVLATASGNMAFRGVVFAPESAPVPEPATVLGVAAAGLALARWRRRLAGRVVVDG